MSITRHRNSLPVSSRSPDVGIRGIPSPAQRGSRSRPVKHRPSGVPALMGPPSHAPGVPVMGAPSPGLYLHAIGGPDVASRLDPMGGPDTGRCLRLLGESNSKFLDSLFAPQRNLR
jgi:hypothetical protein